MIEALFLIGVISVASFANNIITATGPEGKFDWMRSRCFCKKEVLTLSQLVPLFSFLFLKGKCGKCREKIPLRYFWVELGIILLGILLLLRGKVNTASVLSFLLLSSFIVIMFTDYLFYLIPNVVLLFMLIPGIYRTVVLGLPLLSNMISSAIAVLLLFLAKRYYEKQKQKQVIGYGDIKLIAVLFLLYPFWTTAMGIWFSAALGLISYLVIKFSHARIINENKIPFGFFLSTVFLVIEFFSLQYKIESYFSKFFSV